MASVLDHRFKLFGGGEARLADWHGSPMVVHFWASWCPPCVAEMRDALEPMHRQLGGPPRVAEAVLRSLRVGLIVASGFVVVFGVAGVLLSTGVQLVIAAIPWAAIVVGVGLLILGLWLLAERDLPVRVAHDIVAVSARLFAI